MKSVVPFVIFNNTFSVCSQDLFQSLYPSPPISDRKLSYNGSAVSSPPSCADSSCLMAVTRSVARRLATARQQKSDIAWESDEQRYFAELAAEGTRPSKRRKVWRSGQLKCALLVKIENSAFTSGGFWVSCCRSQCRTAWTTFLFRSVAFTRLRSQSTWISLQCR